LVHFFLFWYVVPRKIWQPCNTLPLSLESYKNTRKNRLTFSQTPDLVILANCNQERSLYRISLATGSTGHKTNP
jgi:hypothetical protein